MHKNNNIMVSICTQAFNHEKYVRQCLDGFLAQKTNFSFEILIHDDASTDATISIIREYAAKHPEIVKPYYQTVNQHSKGINTLTRLLFKQAQGMYLAICEADDYWVDDSKLQKQIDYLESHSTAAMCFTNVEVFDDDMQQLKPYWAKIEDRKYDVKDLLKGNVAPMCSVVFRNGLIDFKEVNLEGLPMGDWPIYTLLLRHGGYAKYLDFVSAVYRVRSAGMYSKNSVVTQLEKKHLVYNYFLSRPELSAFKKEILQAQDFNLYAIAVRLNKENKDRKQFLKRVMKGLSFDNISLPLKAALRMIV